MSNSREEAKLRRQAEQRRHEAGQNRAQVMSDELQQRVEQLSSLLYDGLGREVVPSPDIYSVPTPVLPDLSDLDAPIPKPPLLIAPTPPNLLRRTLAPSSQALYQNSVREVEAANNERTAKWEAHERDRLAMREERLAVYERNVDEAEAERQRRHAEFRQLVAEQQSGDPTAIAAYAELTIDHDAYPQGFQLSPAFRFDADTLHLVGEVRLPDYSIIPEELSYKYVKTRQQIDERKRPERDRVALYKRVTASTVLRAISSVLRSDTNGVVEAVAVNGYVHTVDLATGQDVRPTIVSVSTTRSGFDELDLARADPIEALKWLKAKLSPKPHAFVPVQPVLEFMNLDRRFIRAQDVLSDMSHHMNLLELTPGEFEDLVTNLFSAMNYRAISTSRSNDGGVDCIFYRDDPIVGGKYIVQAKRYKDKIGPATVRELIGSLDIEKAGKAVLVATTEYTDGAWELKAKYENIELIDGNHLLRLLRDEAGIEAKIET